MFRSYISTLITIFFQLAIFAIFARVLISWMRVGLHNPIVRFLRDVTEPILAPFRRLIPPLWGVVDLSPLFAFIALDIGRSILLRLIG